MRMDSTLPPNPFASIKNFLLVLVDPTKVMRKQGVLRHGPQRPAVTRGPRGIAPIVLRVCNVGETPFAGANTDGFALSLPLQNRLQQAFRRRMIAHQVEGIKPFR